MACCLNSGLEILVSCMITCYLNRFSKHAREVREKFILIFKSYLPTHSLFPIMTWTKFNRQFFLPCLTIDQGSSRETTTALQFAELAFMKDRTWRRSSFCMEGGNGAILGQSKEKVKKNPIFVHHKLWRFVLNDSKRNALPLLFTIYAVRLNSFSFWLRVHEIPTPTTERKFFDLNFGRMEFVHL